MTVINLTSPARMSSRTGHGDDWRSDGACREEEPDLFFPVGNTGAAVRQIEEAKAVCRRCPVQRQCADWALATRQPHGVWGGIDEDERAVIVRREKRQVTDPNSGRSLVVQRILNDSNNYRRLHHAGYTNTELAHTYQTNAQVVRKVNEILGLANRLAGGKVAA